MIFYLLSRGEYDFLGYGVFDRSSDPYCEIYSIIPFAIPELDANPKTGVD